MWVRAFYCICVHEPPSHLEGISAGSLRCMGVAVYAVIRSVSLACLSIVLYIVFGVLRVVMLCLRMVFRRLVCKSWSLVEVLLLSGLGSIIMGHVRRPPMGESASVYVMSGRMSP